MDYSSVSFLGFSFIPLKIKVEMEFSMSEQMSELLWKFAFKDGLFLTYFQWVLPDYLFWNNFSVTE